MTKKMTDKERLDWIEKHRCYPMAYLEGWVIFNTSGTYFFKSYRAAIDASMNPPQAAIRAQGKGRKNA